MSNHRAIDLFIARLGGHSSLRAEERAALLTLPITPKAYAAHVDIVRLGEISDNACLIADGLVGRYAQTGDGRRQFLSLHFPGEMIDLPSVVVPQATAALNALTATTVLRVPHRALRQLGFDWPALAAAFWRDCLLDAGIVAQWLVSVGRRDARGRIAHLMCELAVRLRGSAPGQATRFPLPMTQEQIGDAMGLTPVHVNRVLRQLREEGLLTVARGSVAIDDWHGLTRAAEFDAAYLHVIPQETGRPAARQ